MSRDESRVTTRANLKLQAATLIKTVGAPAATARMISKAAGVSTGAIFANWKSLGDLMDDAMREDPAAAAIEIARLTAEAERIRDLGVAD